MLIAEMPEHRHEEVVALWHTSGLTRPWNDPHDDLRRALRGPSSTVLAAVAAGGAPELAGAVMVGHDGHRGWLYYLAVDPRHRGLGLGRRLVAAAESWLGDRVPAIHLMVRDDNVAVAAFYEHLGYRRSDVTVLARRLGRP